MKIYAVIDTNVVVSALLARNPEAATVKVFEAFFQGRVVPLVNDEIIKEYADVLIDLNFVFQRNWLILSSGPLNVAPFFRGAHSAKKNFPTQRMPSSMKLLFPRTTPT